MNDSSGVKSLAIVILVILTIVGFSMANRNAQDALYWEEIASGYQSQVDELSYFEDENQTLKDKIDYVNEQISAMGNEVDYVNTTWFATCWDLRDAVADIPIPDSVSY